MQNQQKDDKKLSVKDFIKHRKLQIQKVKGKQQETQNLTQHIQNADISNFKPLFQTLQNQHLVYYLFSEDSIKDTPLMKIISTPLNEPFLNLVSSALQRDGQRINQIICAKWIQNQLVAYDWKNKLKLLNKGIVKLLMNQKDPQTKRKISQNIVYHFSRTQNNFISSMFKQFFTFQMAKETLPSQKTKDNLRQVSSILTLFYIPLFQSFQADPSCHLANQLIDLNRKTIKEIIWINQDFLTAIKENSLDQFTFELKQLNINFMHQIFLSGNLKAVIEAHQLIINSQNEEQIKLLKKAYLSYDSNEQIPVDIALKNWSFKDLQEMIKFISLNQEIIRLSTNSLNIIFQNQKLTQSQKQTLIQTILSDQYHFNGYVDSVKIEKQSCSKIGSKQKFHMSLPTNEISSVIVYDKKAILGKNYKNSYPLVRYMDRFRENSNLKIVQMLFPSQILEKKSTKMKITATIKLFWKVQGNPIQQGSEGQKQIQQVLYYHTSLIYMLCKMNSCDITEYLLDKIFFNCPQLYFKKANKILSVEISRHFLVIYLENAVDFGQTRQNVQILEKVFASKDNQKFIGNNYNMYREILKGLNQSSLFKKFDSSNFMVNKVRSYLREYFDTVSTNSWFGESLDLSYFKDLTHHFFTLIQDKHKRNKKSDKYSDQNDWGLYKASELCDKIDTLKLEAILQKIKDIKEIETGVNQQPKHNLNNQVQALNPLKNQTIVKAQAKFQDKQYDQKLLEQQSILRSILNFKKSLTDEQQQEQQEEYPPLEKEKQAWFRNKFRQHQSLNSLKKYLQKLNYQINNQNSTVPQTIELSLYEKRLKQKIQYIIRQGFNFYFSRLQVERINKEETQSKNKLLFEVFKTPDSPNENILKEPELLQVIERMVKNSTDFITALLFCQQNETSYLHQLWKRKDRGQFMNKLIERFKQRNSGPPRVVKSFKHPQNVIQPIPFHMFLFTKQMIELYEYQEFSQAISILNLFNNIFLNLQSQVIQVSQVQNIKVNKEKLQKEKQYAIQKIVKQWQVGHNWVRLNLNYQNCIELLVREETQRQLKLAKQQKQKQEKRKKGKKNQQLKREEPVQIIEQKQKEGNQLQPQKCAKYLKTYYQLLRQRLLFKYHNRIGMQLTQIIQRLSSQQLFLIDSYKQETSDYSVLLVYAMECSQKPFQVFMQRLNIQPLLKSLSGYRNHDQIKQNFMKQLERLSQQEFVSILQQIQINSFVPLSDILHYLNDQDKLIYVLDYLLSGKALNFKQKFTRNYLIALIRQDLPLFSICLVLIVDKSDFKFWINQKSENGTQKISCDNVNFYSKCNNMTFNNVLKYIEKYYVKESIIVSSQTIKFKAEQIVKGLVQNQLWIRLLQILDMKGLNNLEPFVHALFESIGKNLQSSKNSLKNEDDQKMFAAIIDRLFEIYKSLGIEFEEKLFVNAFKCSPLKAFEFMQPKQLSLDSFVSCLKSLPQQAKLFLDHKVGVNSEHKPDSKYFKSNFPLTPYYYHQFGVCTWLLDVLRVERNLLKAFGQIKRLDKTMESLILLDKMEDNFEEFYTPQEIELKCQKLLTSNTVTSIKKYPNQWFNDYFMTNQIKNLSIMTKQLLIQLIDLSFVNQNHIILIISTCKIQVINYFFTKHSIKLNLEKIQQIQSKHLGPKYKASFWEFLTQIQNQSFVVQFIKTFNLFEVCPTETFDDIILTNVVIFKRLVLFSFLFDYFTQKNDRKLQFVFNKKGKIQNYLIALPEDIAVTMNFYQYYFLVKECKNQCPKFYTSSRFIIQSQNQNQELAKIQFIPELKRRLQILHILSAFTPVHQSINWKQNILLKNLLQLNLKQISNQIIIAYGPPKEEIKNSKWENFLCYLADPSKQLLNKEQIGSLTELLVLYISNSKMGIQVNQLEKSHPFDMKIIKSVEKYIDKNADVSSKAFQIIKKDSKIMAMVMQNNFELFMQNYQNQFENIGRIDAALPYIKAVLANLQNFTKNERYQLCLQKFLGICFGEQSDNNGNNFESNLFLNKYLLQYLLIGFSEGLMSTFNRLVSIKGLKNDNEITEISPGGVLYLVATKLNQKSIKEGFQPSFDMRGWTNVIEQMALIKSPLSQNKNAIHLGQLIQQSTKNLSFQINQKYNSKITNLKEIIHEVVVNAQKSTKFNVYIVLSIFLNQTYLLNSFHEFYNAIKTSLKLKEQNSLKLQVEFSLDKIFQTHFIQAKEDKTETQAHYSLPIGWTTVQNGLPLIQFDIDHVMESSEKEIILQKMKENSQIHSLEAKFYQNSRHFRGRNFQFDPESFKKVKNCSWLKKLIEYFPLTENGVLHIQRILDDLDDNTYLDKTLAYYSLSDVYGPVKLSDDCANADKVIDCLTFYELMDLPKQNIIVEYTDQKPTAVTCSERFVEDFQQYIKFMLNEAKDTHPQDKSKDYNFSHRIQLYIDQNTQKITAFTHKFSLANILRYLGLVNSASDQIRRLFQNRIDVRFDVKSLTTLFHKIKQFRSEQNSSAKNQPILAYVFVRSLLKGRSNNGLIEKVLLMIIEDAFNIMKVLKGTLITYQIVQRKDQKKLYKLHDSAFVSNLEYSIEDQILRITIQLIVDSNSSVIEEVSIDEANLISRKHFLSSIFSSTQFLTDYFLQKNLINNECMKVSLVLSRKLNKTVNLHVDYKSLYSFIDWLKNQVSIKEIDGYLYVLRTYLIANMEKKLTEYSVSEYVLDHHQVLLLNTFELLHLSLLKGHKISYNSIEKQIQTLNEQKDINYFFNKTHNQKGLELLQGYSQEIKNLDDTAKNVFFIQIYKSYFTTVITQGMTFIIGFKQTNKPPTLIKFLKRNDIDKINIVQVSYMLLVTPTIPTFDQLDHNKIIRVFVSDLYKNVYQVSDLVKNYLLNLNQDDSEMRNITSLLPIVPSNLVIIFQHIKNNLQQKNTLKDTKTFQIKLQKQNKFKLVPSQSQPILIHNYLKKYVPLQKQIASFIQNTQRKWGSTDLKLVIDSSKVPNKEVNLQKIAETIKLSFVDIDSALNLYLNQSARNSDLQILYSVYENRRLKENVLVQLRKELFLKYFKSIRIQISQTQSPNIRIMNDEIVVEIGFMGQNKFVKERDIVFEILMYLVEKQLVEKKGKATFETRKQAETMELLKALDVLNIIEVQLRQLDKSLQIKDIWNKGEQGTKPKGLVVLCKSKKSYITQVEGKIQLNFNISNQESEFFSCCQILTLMLNNFKQDQAFQNHKTWYQVDQKSIKFKGVTSENVILVIDFNNKMLCFEEKPIIQNGSVYQIDASKIIQQLNTQLDLASYCYWIIDKQSQQVYSNFIYIINPLPEGKFINKKTISVSTNQTVSLYVEADQQSINMNTCPITLSILLPNDTNPHTYQSILRDQFKELYQVQMICKEIAKIDFLFNSSSNVSISLGGYKNFFDPKSDVHQLIISSTRQAIIQNTKFIEVHFRKRVTQSKEIRFSESKKKNKEKAFIEPAEKASVSQEMQMNVQKQNKSHNIESLVYIVNNDSKHYLTRAGERRVDYIQVCDSEYNPIEYKGEINFYFKHINNLCKIVPQIEKNGLKIGLSWTPTIRGHYKAYLNGICLNPDYEIGVCAAVADPEKSTIENPKIMKICFVEETQFTFNLVDIFNNIYTELEQNILGDGLLIDIQSDNPEITKFLHKKQEKINKYGAKKIRFSINNSSASQSITTTISVSLNKHKMSEFQLQIQGQSLPQRKKNLSKDINSINKGFYKDITVSRVNFIENLFKIAQKSLITNFSIKFAGEQGIDAGGLKREFYDMIGNEMKSENNPFFKATDVKKKYYFFNPDLLKNKKKQNYMELFGKFLANSILNSYLIGINFSPVFVKMLYNDPIDFEDLLQVLPEEEAKRYKYLTYAPAEDFEDLQIYFSAILDKKKGTFVELKQDGANIQVTQENVKEYLDLLTRALVQQRYREVMDAFRNGFETVIPLNIVRKWIRPHEFWCVTQGTKEISAQIVLEYTVFSGIADESIKAWFRRYINQASPEVLQGFLKFTSGSSSIDVETQKLTVTFENGSGNTKKLPISHTCWKEIIIPKYKSYEIMHKLLNAAFIFCSEGFGFG